MSSRSPPSFSSFASRSSSRRCNRSPPARSIPPEPPGPFSSASPPPSSSSSSLTLDARRPTLARRSTGHSALLQIVRVVPPAPARPRLDSQPDPIDASLAAGTPELAPANCQTMKDVFPFGPLPALTEAVQPLADALGLDILPLHIHQILFSAAFYTFVQLVVSPVLSRLLFPHVYGAMTRAKRVNWDVHVVSLVQSVFINGLALWTMYADDERRNMQDDWKERIWGYTNTAAMTAALACGYFLWDLVVTLLNMDIFGPGVLAHAVSALTVFSFGFRPFLNYYGCVFILYELSTPFLNFHWFFDKLNMTGSRAQLYNGIALIVTFFSCRLVYGIYMSSWVYRDMWNAVWEGPTDQWILNPNAPNPPSVRMYGAAARTIPLWLFVLYVASNVVLNSLNVYWFFKMITAVRKRFTPAIQPEKELELTAKKAQ